MNRAAGGRVRRPVAAAIGGGLAVLVLSTFVAGATPALAATARAPGASGNAGSDPGDVGSSRPFSLDWSGYAVTGHTFSDVSGGWTEPTATCTGKKAAQSAFWVGLDGLTTADPTVEQVGTDADCTKGTKKVPSAPVYYAWYELFPASLVVLPTGSYPVAPGDSLSASVHVVGSAYTMAIQDGSKWAYSTVVSTPSAEPDASAEWIAESPSVCKNGKCKPGPLADFGSVAFTSAAADSVPLAGASPAAVPITMTTKKAAVILAEPGAVTGSSGFTVTWLAL